VIGSEEFVGQVKTRLTGSNSATGAISPRRLAGLDRKTIYKAVLSYHERPDEALGKRGDRDWPRAVAAYLARQFTDASLKELAADLGLTRTDSVPNLTRRVERELPATAT
jgi:chromosomal replication initiation ATPase DnaA